MTDIDTSPETDESVEIERAVKLATEKLRNESVKWSEVVDAVAPAKPEPVAAPEHIPLPAVITDDEQAALAKLPEVYGQVVPTERRELLPDERVALLEERTVLKTIKTMVERRSDDIRTSVFNDFDVQAEEAGEVTEDTVRDTNGHYVLKGSTSIEGTGERFSREVRGGSPTLDTEVLRKMAEDPGVEDFTHEDYLAMTSQVRVFDEAKATLALRKNPHLLKAIRTATTRNRPTAALYVRKDKG